MLDQLEGTLTRYAIGNWKLKEIARGRRRLKDDFCDNRSNNSQITKMMRGRRRKPFHTHNQQCRS